ncbi:hypothetical protein JHX88_12000 [Paracoccus saliphilus]|uniref:Homeobox domain-containing protein n=2 Tax=Paracoccus saliphilus TaxID=405559 RepID=A0ABY7SE03_9RHOB|nr:hypothetical protein [Paracoccus saliphilus]WCR05280.1 hypothetical protein JHX88_12000 [Paracoccus saliphilus]
MKHGDFPMKNPAENPRKWFRNMLWRAFPSPSEHDLTVKAAGVLDVSQRQVKNWLREEHDASLRYVMAVIAIAGAEVVFGRIEGRK